MKPRTNGHRGSIVLRSARMSSSAALIERARDALAAELGADLGVRENDAIVFHDVLRVTGARAVDECLVAALRGVFFDGDHRRTIPRSVRQEHAEHGRRPRRVVDLDPAVVLLDDAGAHGEAEAGAALTLLRRVERVEDLVARLGRDAGAGVRTENERRSAPPRLEAGAASAT